MFQRMAAPLLAAALVLGVATLHAQPAAAQTVDEIIKRGKVVIAVDTTTPAYGMIGKDGQPEGYDPDVARLVGKYLGVPVEFVSVTPPNRIPYLLTNRVDMVISLFAVTPERAQQVWFSIPYANSEAVLAAPASRQVKTIDDLAGLRVGLPRGATQDMVLTPIAPKSTTIMRFDDEATALQAMISGQIDVVGTGMLTFNALNRNDPGKKYENKIVLRQNFFCIGVRRGQTELLQWLNSFVFTIKHDGQLDAISRKWREIPLPPLPVF